MISKKLFKKELDLIIANAFREDLGKGDHSSLACIPSNATGEARLLVKQEGIIAGVALAKKIFSFIDSELSFKKLIPDGAPVKPGDVIFEISGRSRSILGAERIVLNCMQRMSAIASKTKEYVNILEGTNAKVLDTRKTTPGIRAIEKWAVSIGGGENHRFALYDMIMLKDNHIDYCGGIDKAIRATKKYLAKKKLDIPIIVEARNAGEVEQILQHDGLYRILLDNFDVDAISAAIKLIGNKYPTEASGNISRSNLRAYGDTGVNYISCGSLTHSVSNLDLSLKAF